MRFNLLGITGSFGSGKTLYGLELGIELAARYNKPLVVNFHVDEKAIRDYCRAVGYTKFAATGRVIRIELFNDLMQLWERPNCVIVFDEAGVFANSRAWKSTPKDFLKNLFQIRHLNIHLLVIFQFYEQVDRQLREVFQCWISCYSQATYDKKLQLPRIYLRRALYYSPEKFLRLEGDVQARGSLVRPWLWASKSYWRFLPAYKLIANLKSLGDLAIYVTRLLLHPNKLISVPQKRYTREDLLFKCFDSSALVGGLSSPVAFKESIVWVDTEEGGRALALPPSED